MAEKEDIKHSLSEEEVEKLVTEHAGWAESIARSVARAWNLDWRDDGLDGAAMEALLFCARRYDPSRGVPFKGYARRRIHEASTEEARKSKGWKTGIRYSSSKQQKARELSVKLLDIFPELREGILPEFEDDELRGSIRILLIGASVAAAKDEYYDSSPEESMDLIKIVEIMAGLEPVHQMILWKTYWEGLSLRRLADSWETDELNVIREHKVLIAHIAKCLSSSGKLAKPKVRPGLRAIAFQLKQEANEGPFKEMLLERRSYRNSGG